MRFHSSALILRKGPKPSMPALVTRMVGRPNRSLTCVTASSIRGRSVTSTSRPTAVPPEASMAAAAASADAMSRSNTATARPSAPSRVAMASPIPEPPPVTMAVRVGVIGPGRRSGRGYGACFRCYGSSWCCGWGRGARRALLEGGGGVQG